MKLNFQPNYLDFAPVCILSVASLVSLLLAGYPRLYHWNNAARDKAIALSRIPVCNMIENVEPGVSTNYAPGKFVCDLEGDTAEVGPNQVVQHIRSAPQNEYLKELKSVKSQQTQGL